MISLMTHLLQIPLHLQSQSSISLFSLRSSSKISSKKSQNDVIVKKSLSAQSSLDQPPEGARSFFRGFSFSWGGEKRKVLEELRDRVIRTQEMTSSSSETLESLSIFEKSVNWMNEVEMMKSE